MSHFVSTGANFDDLHAQLLQRRTESEENEIDETENEEASQQSADGYEVGDDNEGTLRGRPKSSASLHSSDEGIAGRHGQFGASMRRPHLDHTASSSTTMSRKNSQEDLFPGQTSSRNNRRDRKLSDPDMKQARLSGHQQSDSPMSSRPTSPPHRHRHNMHGHKEVAFSEETDEPKSSASSTNETLRRSNSGAVHSPSHRHRFANADQRPHHVLGADHQARLRQSVQAAEVTPPRKLGTWDGVFMPVSLNVSWRGRGSGGAI